MNNDLYGQEFQIPKHILDVLRSSVAKYSNQSVENTKRAKELSETGKGTYQQLKRIKNWFDSNGNTSSPEYVLFFQDSTAAVHSFGIQSDGLLSGNNLIYIPAHSK